MAGIAESPELPVLGAYGVVASAQVPRSSLSVLLPGDLSQVVQPPCVSAWLSNFNWTDNKDVS